MQTEIRPETLTVAPTIRCLPRGVCAWDYDLSGEGFSASTELSWRDEAGSLTVEGTQFEVKKHGVLSGHWTLDHDGIEVASAQKTSALKRTFQIDAPDGELSLRPATALTRRFELARDEQIISEIRPDHAFTRRATLSVHGSDWDWPTVVFAFWLVALMYRRQAQSS